MDTDALVTRIKSEFNESPGMCLTLRQGARLWGIAPEECAKVVERLVAEEFLRWTRNGEVVRSESGGSRRPRRRRSRPSDVRAGPQERDASVGPETARATELSQGPRSARANGRQRRGRYAGLK